ncbi:MAG: hypothetical protein CSA45_05705 [Gammaproteobacteria bacterium]|nr:MAG: hypothetical protein CSA45_05705 [Gammaproteobacteria bacterium]
MKNFDTVIVGGGLGGLTASARLAKAGQKVCLIEQHFVPGGCATVFQRGDFTMEVGLHELDGLDKNDPKVAIFRELDVFNHVEFVKVPEFYRFKHGEADIVIPGNREEATRILTEHFPHERQGIDTFFKKLFAIRREINKLPSKKWQLLLLLPVFPLLFPNLAFGGRKNLGDFLDSIIADDELKLALQANLSYYHDDPYSMSLNYFGVAQASFFAGGGHFIKGGSQQLSSHLAKVITDSGGEVLLATKVTEIIVENDCAVGVVVQKTVAGEGDKQQRINGKTIIANTAVPNVLDLLPEKQRQLFASKIGKLQIAASILSVYIGFKQEVKALGNRHYSTLVFANKTKQLKDVFPQNRSDDFSEKPFIFLDYSQIDSGLAPQGKSVGVITVTDYIAHWQDLNEVDYQAKKAEVAKILLQRVEQLIPGISDAVEQLDVATPKTIRRYTLNPQGTAYGYAQIPAQAGQYRLPNKSPVKNLYFASAWVNPGGGFTGAILSGWFCADEVLRNKW